MNKRSKLILAMILTGSFLTLGAAPHRGCRTYCDRTPEREERCREENEFICECGRKHVVRRPQRKDNIIVVTPKSGREDERHEQRGCRRGRYSSCMQFRWGY